MEDNKKDTANIDRVFLALGDTHPDLANEAEAMWENGFKAKVSKQNFYSFGFRHYNLYTLSCVIYTVSTLAALLLYGTYRLTSGVSFSSLGTKDHSPVVIEANQDTRSTASTTPYTNQGSVHSETEQAAPILENHAAPNSQRTPSQNEAGTVLSSPLTEGENAQTLIPPVEHPVEKNTDQKGTDQQQNSSSQAPLVKIEKRTVVIEKQDTVETYDTIRSERKWRKLNKQK